MAPRKKKTWKSLPEDLKSLQKEDQIFRFNGFWLYDNDRDRTIAEWIEQQKEAKRDVGGLVKDLIYNEATGGRRSNDEVLEALADLRAMISRGVFSQAGMVNPPKAEDVDDLVSKLKGVPT